jgi:hypothetical protein
LVFFIFYGFLEEQSSSTRDRKYSTMISQIECRLNDNTTTNPVGINIVFSERSKDMHGREIEKEWNNVEQNHIAEIT